MDSSESWEKLFLSIGVNKKTAKEYASSETMGPELSRLIKELGCEGDKKVGKLAQELAAALGKDDDGKLKAQSATLVSYIKEGKLETSKQLKAALKYVKETESFSVGDMEKASGVGVVVSEDELRAAVEEVMEEKKDKLDKEQWGAFGAVMRDVVAKQPWADGGAARKALERGIEAKYGPRPAKGKKGKGGQTQQQQKSGSSAPKVVKLEKPDSPFVDARAGAISEFEGKRVCVRGWVHNLRRQKNMLFVDLRDAGSGYVQCVFVGKLAKQQDAQELHREAAVRVYGKVAKLPAGKKSIDSVGNHSEGGVELQADWLEVVGPVHQDIEQVVGPSSGEDQKFDQRHLVLRGKKMAAYLQLRSMVMHSMRSHFVDRGYFEVTPSTLVQTSAEGGSELFSFDFFGETAYLTQSSQLYLETVCPSVGNVYCVLPSFRAEKSRTRRHLAEYTHLEAELPWISFDDLLNAIEDLVCDTIDRLLKIPRAAALLKEENPDFVPLKRPFRRMPYEEAIAFCKEHKIFKKDEDGNDTDEPYEFGDDLPEAAERAVLEILDEPLFFTRFPVPLKAFYMSKCKDDERVTESCDLLLPGVGEVVGGSMRISDYEELVAAYKREGYDPKPYYWYTDQRKFGTVPHGGYGLGIERFLVWLFGDDHIKNVCLYPRYRDRCLP